MQKAGFPIVTYTFFMIDFEGVNGHWVITTIF